MASVTTGASASGSPSPGGPTPASGGRNRPTAGNPTSGGGNAGGPVPNGPVPNGPAPAGPIPAGPIPDGPVPDGPVAYRRRLLRWGAPMGLVVPGAAMLLALVLYRLSPCDGIACVQNVGVWLLAAMALPTALLWGVPLESGAGRYAAAAVTSAIVWAALGHLAARRATRRGLATWRTWWTEYVWFAVAVWVGVAVGLYVIRTYAF